MQNPRALCPQCGKVVEFASSGTEQTCPECGFRSQVAPPVITNKAGSGFAWRPLFRALLIALLVAIGLGVLGIAVLYAGCAMIMKGFN